MTIEIGQTWERRDGRLVKITNVRRTHGQKEFELTPVGKGRKSWKWYGGILSELKPHEPGNSNPHASQ